MCLLNDVIRWLDGGRYFPRRKCGRKSGEKRNAGNESQRPSPFVDSVLLVADCLRISARSMKVKNLSWSFHRDPAVDGWNVCTELLSTCQSYCQKSTRALHQARIPKAVVPLLQCGKRADPEADLPHLLRITVPSHEASGLPHEEVKVCSGQSSQIQISSVLLMYLHRSANGPNSIHHH